jgi:hypothetical protein
MFLDWLRRWRRARVENGYLPDTGAYARQLRTSYLEHLNEEPLTLEQRVAYHLYHLSLYWTRWIGFLDVGASTIGALGLMVQLGTELSEADVREYCDRAGATDLRDEWNTYLAALARVPPSGAAVAHIRHADECFAGVNEIRRARGLLYRYETEPWLGQLRRRTEAQG